MSGEDDNDEKLYHESMIVLIGVAITNVIVAVIC